MVTPYHRDVSPIIQIIRNFLRGRSWNEQLRKQKDISPRPYPQPELPPGPSEKVSVNYYLSRDARRMVSPPLSVANNTTKRLTSGEIEEKTLKKTSSTSVPKPGNIYNF